jgi:hypothetical protein
MACVSDHVRLEGHGLRERTGSHQEGRAIELQKSQPPQDKKELSSRSKHRVPPLVGALSRDADESLTRVLTSHRLLYTPYYTFKRLLMQAMNIFWTLNERFHQASLLSRARNSRNPINGSACSRQIARTEETA